MNLNLLDFASFKSPSGNSKCSLGSCCSSVNKSEGQKRVRDKSLPNVAALNVKVNSSELYKQLLD